jgi:putative endonuclease
MINFSPKELGKVGETIAKNYLQKKGYQILAENYIPKWASFDRKEIDIVAKKDGAIVFIEVKTTSEDKNPNFVPEDKINFLKQKKIMKVAESYLLEKKIPLNSKWQIDTISVRIDPILKKAKIRHLRNVIF